MTAACLSIGSKQPIDGLPEGFELHHVKCVDSTNDEASRVARAGAPSGTIIMADRQTKGRGRLGRHWVSPIGNFHASVVLRIGCEPDASAGLSLLTAVALGEALLDLGPKGLDLALKWPNDILIGGAKTAGILLERGEGEHGQDAFVVIGTGVNIKSRPNVAVYPVTCLAVEGFDALSPHDLLAAYTAKLQIWLDRWQRGGFPVVRAAWRDKAYRLGQAICLRLEREQIEGVFVDLTEGGALLIEQPDGRRREIAAGDVVYPDN